MPEGDTVWRLARRLDRELTGATVAGTDVRHPRLATVDLTGREILGHATHGKHLLTRFAGGRDDGLTLHSHLRMDGEWSVTRPGRRLPGRLMHEVRLVLTLDDARTVWGLRLHDLALVATRDEDRVVGHLGPDPLRDDWDLDEAVRRLRRAADVPFVVALQDQRLVAGLGNLWANELCFLTGVSPWTTVGTVDRTRDLPLVIGRAARMLSHSATHRDAYQVTTGDTRRAERHWVAGRAGRPCLRCGRPVSVVAEVRGDPARRRTWWCPSCQPEPRSYDRGEHRPSPRP